MTPEALRIAVAEALGWHHCFISDGRCYGTPDWEKRELPQAACLSIPEPKPFFHPIPKYEVSLDACLPLIERLNKDGLWIEQRHTPNGHDCQIWKPGTGFKTIEVEGQAHPATALCLAALKAFNKLPCPLK